MTCDECGSVRTLLSEPRSALCRPCSVLAPPLIVRFRASYVVNDNGCWIWTRLLNRYGYAEMKVDNRSRGGHRVAYELLIGPIPNGLQIDHLCRVRACVNPAHLEAVTAQVNTLRSTNFAATNAKKVECLRGHPFTPENTRVDSKNRRNCQECARFRSRRRHRAVA